jgi:hypothetical protein
MHRLRSSAFLHPYNMHYNVDNIVTRLGDRRRGIGLTIGFNAHFNQLQLIISILQPPTLWASFSIYPAFSLGSILDNILLLHGSRYIAWDPTP